MIKGTSKKGKRLKLTRRVQERIVEAIKQGSSHTIAYGCAGISRQTFYRWLRLGEEEDNPQEVYASFAKAVRKAEGEHFESMASVVTSAAKEGSWHAAAWMLERRHRDDFGKLAPPPRVDKLLEFGLVLFDQEEKVLEGAQTDENQGDP